MKIAVCWKWVSLDADLDPDDRRSGVSLADEAALEVALRASDDVTLVMLGPHGADEALRAGVAAGASRAVRIDASTDLDGRVVASAIASVVRGVDVIVCGDYSLDRGTGSVPAFIAAELGAAQALGLVDIELDATPPRAVRRLDGGRREILGLVLPTVTSVEGAVASLRRASMSATLAAAKAPIEVVAGPTGHGAEFDAQPYRPRPRTIAAPTGDSLTRVREILDIGGGEVHADTVVLDPPDAAARIVEQLRDWGYLDDEGR
jgi:electron transfer flavoprotein beta subunit